MWYRFALDITEITPEHISRMRELNKFTHPDLLKSKHEYLDTVSKLNPVDHPGELDEHWNKFRGGLGRYSHLPSDSQESFESWRVQNPNDIIESTYEEYEPDQLKKDFRGSGELDFEAFKARKLNSKAYRHFSTLRSLETLEKQFGLSSSETNPLIRYKKLRNLWAEALSENYKKQIPMGTQAVPTVTIVIGFPGAGKNSYIKPDPEDQNVVKNTPLGLLIDPDETQRDMIGYMGGAGSSETLNYANKIKLLLVPDALEKRNNVVIPMVGGKATEVINTIVDHVSLGRRVNIVLVPTDAHTAHQRSTERARKENERLISPYITSGRDPNTAFVEAKNIIEHPDYENLDHFTKKLLEKKYQTTAAGKLKAVPLEEKQSLRQEATKLVSFRLAE